MKLTEVMVSSNQQLTIMQQTCLLKVYLAQSTSPEAAAQTMKGNSQLIAAGEFLLNNGMLIQANGGVMVGPTGKNEISMSGLVDNNGVTEKGRQLIDQTSPTDSN